MNDLVSNEQTYSGHNFSPNSNVEAVVYLFKYQSKKKIVYKIGICTLTNLNARRNSLQNSINNSSSKENFVIVIEDYIQYKNKYVAKEIESVFEGYYRLRDNIKSKKNGKDISGNTEFYKQGICKKWYHYKEHGVFNPKGLTAESILRYSINILDRRWVEAEDIIITSKKTDLIFRYSTKVIKGKWAEAEDYLLGIEYEKWHKKTGIQLETDGPGEWTYVDGYRRMGPVYGQFDIYSYAFKRKERWLDFEIKLKEWIHEGKTPNPWGVYRYHQIHKIKSTIIRDWLGTLQEERLPDDPSKMSYP